jgi:hypothetical protein
MHRVRPPKPVTVPFRPKEEEVLIRATGQIVSNFTIEDMIQQAIRETEEKRLSRTP